MFGLKHVSRWTSQAWPAAVPSLSLPWVFDCTKGWDQEVQQTHHVFPQNSDLDPLDASRRASRRATASRSAKHLRPDVRAMRSASHVQRHDCGTRDDQRGVKNM